MGSMLCTPFTSGQTSLLTARGPAREHWSRLAIRFLHLSCCCCCSSSDTLCRDLKLVWFPSFVLQRKTISSFVLQRKKNVHLFLQLANLFLLVCEVHNFSLTCFQFGIWVFIVVIWWLGFCFRSCVCVCVWDFSMWSRGDALVNKELAVNLSLIPRAYIKCQTWWQALVITALERWGQLGTMPGTHWLDSATGSSSPREKWETLSQGKRLEGNPWSVSQ